MIEALRQFSEVGRGTRVRLKEAVLSGATEALLNGETDLAIAISVPGNFMGDMLAEIEFVAVAHPDHPLQRLRRTLVAADLRREIQVVISDSGVNLKRDEGWLGAERKWYVTTLETALAALISGLGWLPLHMVEEPIHQGKLKPLPLREGSRRQHTMYLIYAQQQHVGPATLKLAAILREVAESIELREMSVRAEVSPDESRC